MIHGAPKRGKTTYTLATSPKNKNANLESLPYRKSQYDVASFVGSQRKARSVRPAFTGRFSVSLAKTRRTA